MEKKKDKPISDNLKSLIQFCGRVLCCQRLHIGSPIPQLCKASAHPAQRIVVAQAHFSFVTENSARPPSTPSSSSVSSSLWGPRGLYGLPPSTNYMIWWDKYRSSKKSQDSYLGWQEKQWNLGGKILSIIGTFKFKKNNFFSGLCITLFFSKFNQWHSWYVCISQSFTVINW